MTQLVRSNLQRQCYFIKQLSKLTQIQFPKCLTLQHTLIESVLYAIFFMYFHKVLLKNQYVPFIVTMLSNLHDRYIELRTNMFSLGSVSSINTKHLNVLPSHTALIRIHHMLCVKPSVLLRKCPGSTGVLH